VSPRPMAKIRPKALSGALNGSKVGHMWGFLTAKMTSTFLRLLILLRSCQICLVDLLWFEYRFDEC
jgi:hypothetical protein